MDYKGIIIYLMPKGNYGCGLWGWIMGVDYGGGLWGVDSGGAIKPGVIIISLMDGWWLIRTRNNRRLRVASETTTSGGAMTTCDALNQNTSVNYLWCFRSKYFRKHINCTHKTCLRWSPWPRILHQPTSKVSLKMFLGTCQSKQKQNEHFSSYTRIVWKTSTW